MTVTDAGDVVTVTAECGCGQVFEMTASWMDEFSGLERACYVARMRWKAELAIIRHCRIGASRLN